MEDACYSLGILIRAHTIYEVVLEPAFVLEAFPTEPRRVSFELRFASAFLALYHGNSLSNVSHIWLTSTGPMGTIAVARISDTCFPCISHEFVWQGLTHHPSPPVLNSAFISETNLGGLHRIPEYWQIFHHQYLEEKTCLYSCPYTWRDQSLAVHHADEKNISD